VEPGTNTTTTNLSIENACRARIRVDSTTWYCEWTRYEMWAWTPSRSGRGVKAGKEIRAAFETLARTQPEHSVRFGDLTAWVQDHHAGRVAGVYVDCDRLAMGLADALGDVRNVVRAADTTMGLARVFIGDVEALAVIGDGWRYGLARFDDANECPAEFPPRAES
jgi:hypothetical protein